MGDTTLTSHHRTALIQILLQPTTILWAILMKYASFDLI